MGVLSNLEPKRVFHFFEEICGIPHGSYHEEEISEYLVTFAKKHQIEYYQDDLHNVMMRIPASEGYEQEEPIILQGHMDMVCEKRPEASIDMNKEGLQLAIDNDYVYAKDTTLGGDDGIALAYMLAIAEDYTILHPPLEYIFTVSEEVGMHGAAGIDLSMLKGKRMLNIDSEEEGIFLTSCAGGVGVKISIPVNRKMEDELLFGEIVLSGLAGGHSGVEIDKGRANANKIIARVLYALCQKTDCYIAELQGGSKDNAIPSYACVKIGVKKEDVNTVYRMVSEFETMLAAEYVCAEPSFSLKYSPCEMIEQNLEVLDLASGKKVIGFLMASPNGVQEMSMSVPGLVETSLNLGVLNLNEKDLQVTFSVRSSVTSRKQYVVEQLDNLAKLFDGVIVINGDYPAWEYRQISPMRDRIVQIYTDMYGKEPVFEGIHAGLECGIIASKIEDLDCVSLGPDILDIHTPMERLSISSTKRFYDFLLNFIKAQ